MGCSDNLAVAPEETFSGCLGGPPRFYFGALMAKTGLGETARETTGVGVCDEPGHKADATYQGSGRICIRARLMGGKFKHGSPDGSGEILSMAEMD